jgi:hypothetical protein
MRRFRNGLVTATLAPLLLLAHPRASNAEGLGTVGWQLAPLCNALTLTGSWIRPNDDATDMGSPQLADVMAPRDRDALRIRL